MKKQLSRLLSNNVLFFFICFLLYTLITGVIFSHRLPTIFTHYAMPDIDTDGGLWYQWFLVYINKNDLLYDIVELVTYPLGYDIAFSPVDNLIYTFQAKILSLESQFNWQTLIFITNFSSLINYPLAGLGALLLSYYLTRHRAGSFIAGLTYAFSFYFIFMGRGQMSINHAEFIPYYVLSLVYYLDTKTKPALIFSTLFFAVLFKVDAYYAFFSGIFSVLFILLYKRTNINDLIKTSCIYYACLLFFLVVVNLNFIVSNLYLFNNQLAVQSGRNSTAKGELVPLTYNLSAPENSFLYSIAGRNASFIYIIPIVIAIFGLYKTNKKSLYSLLLACYLLAVLLHSYIIDLFFINEIYFKFFGIFRGVGRLSIPAALFLGIMIAISVKELDNYLTNKKIYLTYILLIGIIIVISGLNIDGTWYKKTNFSHIATLYEPIKNNQSIKVIAPYPMTLGSDTVGFPINYQELGQIVHNKPLTSGASPFSLRTVEYQKEIKDINNENTIPNLTRYSIDTILIYNNLMPNSDSINEKLINDGRLTYVGRYTAPYDEGYTSSVDSSKDISVYQIKEVVNNNQKTKPLFYLESSYSNVEWKKVSASQYELHINNLADSDLLVFNSPYTKKWDLYPYAGNTHPILFLFNKKIFIDQHILYDDIYNAWNVSANEIKNNPNQEEYEINPDGTVNVKLSLFYTPTTNKALFDSLSQITILISLLYILLHKIKTVKL